MTYGDLFTGFGGATVGAMAAGLNPIWGIEYDAKIAAVANDNLGGHVITANILDVDVHTLPSVDVLHASPPCPNFSVAKTGGGETEADKQLARKVIQFVDLIRPRIFTLENVYGYRHSQSWRMIQDALFNAGYWVSMEHVNAANFGVPQTRQRMIVRAVRGGWVPYLPQASRWVGWYEAIEDLIQTLPASQFAPWQIKRLPADISTTLWTTGRSYDQHGNEKYGAVTRDQNEPSATVRAHSGPDRAFLMMTEHHKESPLGREGRGGIIPPGCPANTVVTAGGNSARAFIVGGANTSDPQAAEGVGVSMQDEPTRCVNASNSTQWRAWLQHGRVVAMTTRALARFQSFPDSYRLSGIKTLDARGIGNAVPPLLYRRIVEGLVQS